MSFMSPSIPLLWGLSPMALRKKTIPSQGNKAPLLHLPPNFDPLPSAREPHQAHFSFHTSSSFFRVSLGHRFHCPLQDRALSLTSDKGHNPSSLQKLEQVTETSDAVSPAIKNNCGEK